MIKLKNSEVCSTPLPNTYILKMKVCHTRVWEKEYKYMRLWWYQLSYDNWYSQHMISWATMKLQDYITTSDGSIFGKNWDKIVQIMYKIASRVSLKSQHHVDSNLRIPNVPMACIAMDLLREYNLTTCGHCYALTVICIRTSFAEGIPIEDKKTKRIIKVCIKYVYTGKGGSKFILTARGGQFSSEAMTHTADQLGFKKVYTSPHSPQSNSVIGRCHSFL